MLSSLTTLLRTPYFFHRGGPASDGPHSGFSTYSQKYPCITLRLQYTYIQPSFFYHSVVIFPLYTQRPGDTGRQGGFTAVATHSRASIGSLLASSFCERINSGGKITLNEGNARLSQGELDRRTTLRMNKGFMNFMRKNYPRVASMKVGSLKVRAVGRKEAM